MASTVTTVTMGAGAWAPRRRQGAAVLPIVVGCQGATETLVPDLVHEPARVIPWAEAGENVVPFDALPEGVLNRVPYAGFGIELVQEQLREQLDEPRLELDLRRCRAADVATLARAAGSLVQHAGMTLADARQVVGL